jgi:Omp85 superfamily domain/Calcineurin-like phosphoesterase
MGKIIKLIFAIILPCMYCHAQIDSINKRIILVGDAGDIPGGHNQVIDWLKKNVDWNDERNVIVFLGDNIYPLGMPTEGESTYPQARRIIDYQISLVKGNKSKAYFIPGNHDWKNGKIGGWEQVKNQVNYINSLGLTNVRAEPIDGCPGPVEVDLSDKVVLVLMDSQWWLHLHDKPGNESDCDYKSEDEVIVALREIASSNPNKLLIVATHHPLYSYGVHGGNYTWRHHIFPFTDIISWLYIPLPVIGSIYPITRGIFGNIQDVNHPKYRTMIKGIETALKEHMPNVIQVAGHDHGLQMLMKDSIPYIVSGGGLNTSRVKTGKRTLYAAATTGFAILEVRKSGKIETKFYTMNGSQNLETPSFTKELKPLIAPEEQKYARFLTLPDSVVAIANPKLKGNGFKRFFFGKNYRAEWIEPVKVKVLDIKKEMGGLVAIKRGGGKQTHSLRVVDSTGKEYSLRSIEKFPVEAIPAELRQTIVKNIVEDGVSASYPYSSLSTGYLESACGLPVLKKQLLYVPDDTLLGRFRTDFRGRICVLEERDPFRVKKTFATDEIAIQLLKDNDNHVNQKAVLNARLLDMFIMDFDRHEGQWRWYTTDTGKGKIYNPIPKDRDQAFFTNQGQFPKLVRKSWLIPEIQGLQPKAYNIKTFNKPARNFDRSFLNELNEDDWKVGVDTFLTRMTDQVIETALDQQPQEIQKYAVPKIISILKKRRKYMKSDMIEYYRFISRIVNVVGTDKQELFTITRNSNGTVQVEVDKINKSGNISSKIYDRLFVPSTTKEIRLYGMGDDDKFVFKGDHSSPIKIRVIGGIGDDEFDNESSTAGKILIYDVDYEKNKFTGNDNLRKKIMADPNNNKYDRIYYKYNVFHPGGSIGYNIDDGIYIGARLRYTTQGFRKDPYSMYHDLRVTHAVNTGSYTIRYYGEFIKALGNSDFLILADVRAPNNITNFFGLGNNTVLDKTKPDGIRFYRARYNLTDLSALVRRRLQSWMDITFGPSYEHYSISQKGNEDRILFHPSQIGLDSANVYRQKAYLGAQFGLIIDTRNSKVLPTRGITLQAAVRPLFALNNNSHNIIQIKYDMALYISKLEQTKVVFATRFGVAHTYGNYEFFQAQFLSGTDNLRGYRKYRFAGRTMLFSNNDLRIKIADFNTYLFGGALGLVGFYDVGRVWPNQGSNTWHGGFGGGIWISPLKQFVFTISVAHSKEETLPYATVGYQF